jgi:alpha-1,2-glucosyltransferase
MIVGTGFCAMLCRNLVEARLNDSRSTVRLKSISYYSVHTGVNIALFPVLFFFSGLYYTDIASTLVVLLAYHNHLGRVAPEGKTILNDIWTVILGAFALFMRQTNIFWVVVYMGGLEAVHAVKTLRPGPVDQSFAMTLTNQFKFFAGRYALGEIHDLPLNLAWPDGMIS